MLTHSRTDAHSVKVPWGYVRYRTDRGTSILARFKHCACSAANRFGRAEARLGSSRQQFSRKQNNGEARCSSHSLLGFHRTADSDGCRASSLRAGRSRGRAAAAVRCPRPWRRRARARLIYLRCGNRCGKRPLLEDPVRGQGRHPEGSRASSVGQNSSRHPAEHLCLRQRAGYVLAAAPKPARLGGFKTVVQRELWAIGIMASQGSSTRSFAR